MEEIINFFTDQLENEYHQICDNFDQKKEFFKSSILDDESIQDIEIPGELIMIKTKSLAKKDFKDFM